MRVFWFAALVSHFVPSVIEVQSCIAVEVLIGFLPARGHLQFDSLK